MLSGVNDLVAGNAKTSLLAFTGFQKKNKNESYEKRLERVH